MLRVAYGVLCKMMGKKTCKMTMDMAYFWLKSSKKAKCRRNEKDNIWFTQEGTCDEIIILKEM